MKVGILAVQGDFAAHFEKVSALCDDVTLVKTPTDLQQVQRLIIPGGESTAFLRLIDDQFRAALKQKITNSMPVLATCAGSILLAKRVENPSQESLELLSCTAERNSYGRQLDSFITPSLLWTEQGRSLHKTLLEEDTLTPVEGVFIRAPRFKDLETGVEVILTHSEQPVLIKEGNILAATFHPELSDSDLTIHKLFLSLPVG